ncbi:MAG: translational GTPase TypA, partial [Verrucomicrobia bacterium]|nr:translational GTPase TypA [Verrucomicrobiota bacterium]
LGMVSSVLLLVDAQEGPMPQTRFVLSKSLKMGLCPIVVVNKIDRPFATPDKALDLTFDLFTELGATDKQLDFAFCYASGLSGFAIKNIDDPRDQGMRPLFEMIVDKVPPPPGNQKAPFLCQVSTIFYDDYVGRQACGRIINGSVKKGDTLMHIDKTGTNRRITVSRIEGHIGLEKQELEIAGAGDIVILSGTPDATIGDTLCDPNEIVQLPPIQLDEPTVSIDISVNTSPFVGRSGKHVTMNKLKDRLERERRANISLKIDFSSNDQDIITIAGRGELHLSVLIEAMRREGFEMSLSKPRVIIKREENQELEPFEIATIEVPEAYSGGVIEELSRRRGEMQSLDTSPEGITRMEFRIPTRGLMGYRSDFLTQTRGLGILTSVFEKYAPLAGPIAGRKQGVMVSSCQGKSTPYAAFQLQDRGWLFVGPQDEVYEGMIVGEHSRDNDIVVNITKEKQLTNVRASGSDENVILTPHRRFTLEQAIDFIQNDELIEVTPGFIRMRKRMLQEVDRKRQK